MDEIVLSASCLKKHGSGSNRQLTNLIFKSMLNIVRNFSLFLRNQCCYMWALTFSFSSYTSTPRCSCFRISAESIFGKHFGTRQIFKMKKADNLHCNEIPIAHPEAEPPVVATLTRSLAHYSNAFTHYCTALHSLTITLHCT